MPASGFDKELRWYLYLSVLSFFNEGSFPLSTGFLDEPWAWLLMVPLSIYLKFILELHFVLGILLGVFVPCLAYWGFTSREPPEWYFDAVLKFNVYFLKTSCLNFVIGLVYYLVNKLLHDFKFVSWNVNVFSGIASGKQLDTKTAALTALAGTREVVMLVLKLVGLLFYNGNVLLLSWAFTGNDFSFDIVKGMSWICMGSVMCKWQKHCLKEVKIVPLHEGKLCTVAEVQSEPNMNEVLEEGPSPDISGAHQSQL